MNNTLMILGAGAALFIGSLAVTQPQVGVPGEPPTNRELNIGITQEFENMNPVIMSMVATTYTGRMVGRSLVQIDEHNNWLPQLAIDIPTLENGLARLKAEGDRRWIEADYEIEPKAVWGDGQPLTCADFRFAWEVGSSPNVSVPNTEAYRRIRDIRVDPDNPKQCTFVYRDALWDFNRHHRFHPLPEHLERPVFERHGNEPQGYEQHSLYSMDATNPGLYHGPYLVKDMVLGSHIILERNPGFYGDRPHIDRIVIKLIPNTGTLEANLRSGTLDMVSTLGMSFDQALAFEERVQREELPFNVHFVPGMTYEHLELDLAEPFLNDLNVRRALTHAIDRKGLSKALFDGKQPPALHNFAPADAWYTDDPEKIVVYRYSRRLANRLLEDAGYEMGEDGYRYNDAGERLRLRLMTTAGNKIRELVQIYLQDQWRAIGVDVRIQNEPARVFFGETLRRRTYDGVAMFAWSSSPESTPRSQFSAEQIPSEENGWSGQNYMGWSNPTVETLLDQLDREFDAQKRLKVVHEMLYHYTNEVPRIPLFYRSETSVTPANMVGYQITSHQISAANHV
ncbi:MAG: peptide ABC transporter substrate-binding protein, partial [Pseudomonadales bacterium]